jgi:GNAT superfamily N-acetyltransferase
LDDILTDLSAESLARAAKRNMYAFMLQCSHWNRAELYHGPGFTRWRTPLHSDLFNGVLSFGDETEVDDSLVKTTLAYFRSHTVQKFLWWLESRVDEPRWRAALERRDFKYEVGEPGMALQLDALRDMQPTPPSLSIRVVDDRQLLKEVARIQVRAFDMPDTEIDLRAGLWNAFGLDLPARYYLGLLDGKRVATAILFVAAGVAGIYGVATLHEARGIGVGAAMTLALLQDARWLGYRAAVLQASQMGLSVYQRLGFNKICDLDHFAWTDPSPA